MHTLRGRQMNVGWVKIVTFDEKRAITRKRKVQHRSIDVRVNSYTNASTSCEILLKIGAVTSDSAAI